MNSNNLIEKLNRVLIYIYGMVALLFLKDLSAQEFVDKLEINGTFFTYFDHVEPLGILIIFFLIMLATFITVFLPAKFCLKKFGLIEDKEKTFKIMMLVFIVFVLFSIGLNFLLGEYNFDIIEMILIFIPAYFAMFYFLKNYIEQ